MRGYGRRERHRVGARRLALAATLALASLVVLPFGGAAHTCVPDAEVGVGGRLLLPRASGLALMSLPDRDVRPVPILPARGVTTAVASTRDGGLLAVSRFWRPPHHQIGGQDILIVGADGGEPIATLERGRPGEELGSPSWLPDGSLVYERRDVGRAAMMRVERRALGDTDGTILADGARSPAVSPDGARLAFVRSEQVDRLIVRDLAGGDERVLVDEPSLVSLAFPRFSPDGTWIAFSAVADPALGASPLEPLAFVGTSTSPRRSATSALGARTAHAHGLPWDIFAVRADGSEWRRITYFYDDDPAVAWSPDGRWLVTFSGEALHVVAADGAADYCLAGEGGYGALEWLP
ncbi:MAG: hypothetical protein M3O34_13925 [Chloroflexota bacterium]|nr:hypothetical protein [Chloroflexota bacterium]